MKIVKIKIADLQEDPNNIRDHTVENIEMIKRSLQENKQYKPLIVDEDTMTVKIGNGRYRAMKQMHWEDCDCILVNWQDKDGMEVMDNRLNELSEWNKKEVFDWLLNEKDLDWWGVDTNSCEMLLKITKSRVKKDDREVKPEPPQLLCPCCGKPLVKKQPDMFL